MPEPEVRKTLQTGTFRGTQVRDDGKGPVLVSHRQRVVVVDGPDKGREAEAVAPRLTIGSGANNTLVLTDAAVSRHHCEIAVRDERYLLRDLGSTNGTRLGDTPVLEAYLSPGSRIRIGYTEILFEPRKKWERVSEPDEDNFGSLYGTSHKMRSIFGLLAKVAPTDLSVVISGETGTGKELAARAVHDKSTRAKGPFVVVDCGAMSANLVESELFGHEKGAFTGAERARVGAFEFANNGTIFLDEIGELPLDLQPKLLRVLERREIKRLGASKPVEVNVRVITATHRDLGAMIRAGRFREDIYYRLAEVMVEMPALRDRREDIPLLVKQLLRENTEKWGDIRDIDEEALRYLVERPWPGNVRELRNVIRRAATLASGSMLRRTDLSAPPGARSSTVRPLGPGSLRPSSRGSAYPVMSGDPYARKGAMSPPPVPRELAEGLSIKEARERWLAPMEREYLIRLVRHCEGDLDRAAKEAGLHRKSLERLLRQRGIKAADLKTK
ncbi:MAG: sigma 54-dependent Fis family transcriptional regulator [Myxococcales bacterium]|nr:sigma 54-dependent Fis family transcriptional regulator [Myxococcales bacterium]MCB9709301.1 sigma 54-dependent Fis family transcriptional regulator [Myxococcales bacterium]